LSYFIADADCAGLFETMNVGWTADSQDIGKSCTHKLAQCLWYLDSHHQKFADRGMKLPMKFSSFQGYNNYKRKKERKPRLSAKELNHHVELLSDIVMQPWFSHACFKIIRKDVAELTDVMHQYAAYLLEKNEKVKDNHSVVSTKDAESSATLTTLPAKF